MYLKAFKNTLVNKVMIINVRKIRFSMGLK